MTERSLEHPTSGRHWAFLGSNDLGEVSCTYLSAANREPQAVGAIEQLVAFASESISEVRTVTDAGSTMDIPIPCIASQRMPM